MPPAPSFPRRQRFINHRDIWREMDELSEEEAFVGKQKMEVNNRGFKFLIPIGRTWTQHDEKNNADNAHNGSGGSDGSDESDSESGTVEDADENNSSEYSSEEEEDDLDADVEDLDQAAANAVLDESVNSEESSGGDDSDD